MYDSTWSLVRKNNPSLALRALLGRSPKAKVKPPSWTLPWKPASTKEKSPVRQPVSAKIRFFVLWLTNKKSVFPLQKKHLPFVHCNTPVYQLLLFCRVLPPPPWNYYNGMLKTWSQCFISSYWCLCA